MLLYKPHTKNWKSNTGLCFLKCKKIKIFKNHNTLFNFLLYNFGFTIKKALMNVFAQNGYLCRLRIFGSLKRTFWNRKKNSALKTNVTAYRTLLFYHPIFNPSKLLPTNQNWDFQNIIRPSPKNRMAAPQSIFTKPAKNSVGLVGP